MTDKELAKELTVAVIHGVDLSGFPVGYLADQAVTLYKCIVHGLEYQGDLSGSTVTGDLGHFPMQFRKPKQP